MFASPVWHYWIAVILMITLIIPVTVATVALYLKKVVQPKYPGVDQERG